MNKQITAAAAITTAVCAAVSVHRTPRRLERAPKGIGLGVEPVSVFFEADVRQ